MVGSSTGKRASGRKISVISVGGGRMHMADGPTKGGPRASGWRGRTAKAGDRDNRIGGRDVNNI